MRRFLHLSVLGLAVGVMACEPDPVRPTVTPPVAAVRFVHAAPDFQAVDFRFIDMVENSAHYAFTFRHTTNLYYKATQAGQRHLRIFLSKDSLFGHKFRGPKDGDFRCGGPDYRQIAVASQVEEWSLRIAERCDADYLTIDWLVTGTQMPSVGDFLGAQGLPTLVDLEDPDRRASFTRTDVAVRDDEPELVRAVLEWEGPPGQQRTPFSERLERCAADARFHRFSQGVYREIARTQRWPALPVALGRCPSLFVGIGQHCRLVTMNQDQATSSTLALAAIATISLAVAGMSCIRP